MKSIDEIAGKELIEMFHKSGFVPIIGEPEQQGQDYVGKDPLEIEYRFREYDTTAFSMHGKHIYCVPENRCEVVEKEQQLVKR